MQNLNPHFTHDHCKPRWIIMVMILLLLASSLTACAAPNQAPTDTPQTATRTPTQTATPLPPTATATHTATPEPTAYQIIMEACEASDAVFAAVRFGQDRGMVVNIDELVEQGYVHECQTAAG